MNTNLRRGLVPLVTAFACLVLMGSPASAAVIPVDITAGTVTIINSTGTATDTIPLGPGVTTLGTDCIRTIEGTTTATTTSVTNWEVTDYRTVTRFHIGSIWYVADMQRTSSTAGTVTSVTTTSATLNSASLGLTVSIYSATDQTATGTSCTHGTTRSCRFGGVSLALQGSYSGDIHNPSTSHTATLGGTGALGPTTPPCVAPFSTYANGTTTITGLVAHVL